MYEHVILYGIGGVSVCQSVVVLLLLGALLLACMIDKWGSFIEKEVSTSCAFL